MDVVHWVGTLLCAKVFAGMCRRDWGLADDKVAALRAGYSVDLPYVYLLTMVSVAIQWGPLVHILLLAALLRLCVLCSSRVLLAANHHFIELLAMLLVARLHNAPLSLAAALQVMVLSIWLYAVFQKVYHGDFVSGLFFLVLFQRSSASHRWAAMAPWVRPLEGRRPRVDRTDLAFPRCLALAAIAIEVVGPIAAIAASGTWWGVATMVGASLAIACSSAETSFLVTNVALSLVFGLPLDYASLLSAMCDPAVAVILGYCLVWPPLHAILTRHLRISTWRLGGWGMYATLVPRVALLDSNGHLTPLCVSSRPLALLEFYGRCRCDGIRRFAQRSFLRSLSAPHSARAFVFHGWTRQGPDYLVEVEVCPTLDASSRVFILNDQASLDELDSYVRSLAARPGARDVEPLHSLQGLPERSDTASSAVSARLAVGEDVATRVRLAGDEAVAAGSSQLLPVYQAVERPTSIQTRPSDNISLAFRDFSEGRYTNAALRMREVARDGNFAAPVRLAVVVHEQLNAAVEQDPALRRAFVRWTAALVGDASGRQSGRQVLSSLLTLEAFHHLRRNDAVGGCWLLCWSFVAHPTFAVACRHHTVRILSQIVAADGRSQQ